MGASMWEDRRGLSIPVSAHLCYATVMDTHLVQHFSAHGFVVLRQVCDAQSLQAEVLSAVTANRVANTGVASVQYAPMMSQTTPTSLALLDAFTPMAETLLGAAVLPVRAKGQRYHGSTPWHTDSTRPVPSVGFAAYLEPLTWEVGALRVLPGSHHPEYGNAVAPLLAAPGSLRLHEVPGWAVETQPGDIIVFDEHLYHASSGGTQRLQWRVDFVRDPVSAAEQEEVQAYFAQIFPPDWDGGYNPDMHPSYGPDWLASDRPAAIRLRQLGVYELATKQEAFMRLRQAVP